MVRGRLLSSTPTGDSPHVVFVPVLGFLDDELSVKQDEATHDEQPHIQVGLEGTHTHTPGHMIGGAKWRPRCRERHSRAVNGTLKSMTEPKKMLKRDTRRSSERADIRVPAGDKDSPLLG